MCVLFGSSALLLQHKARESSDTKNPSNHTVPFALEAVMACGGLLGSDSVTESMGWRKKLLFLSTNWAFPYFSLKYSGLPVGLAALSLGIGRTQVLRIFMILIVD